MASTFTLFNSLAGKVGDGTIDLDSHSFKFVLSNVAPVATNTVLADITQIAAGNGYATGGIAITGVTFTEASAGVWQWDSDNLVATASGGAMATFRYIVIYDDTAASDDLVGYYDYGAAVSLSTDASYTQIVNANGHFQITKTP